MDTHWSMRQFNNYNIIRSACTALGGLVTSNGLTLPHCVTSHDFIYTKEFDLHYMQYDLHFTCSATTTDPIQSLANAMITFRSIAINIQIWNNSCMVTDQTSRSLVCADRPLESSLSCLLFQLPSKLIPPAQSPNLEHTSLYIQVMFLLCT